MLKLFFSFLCLVFSVHALAISFESFPEFTSLSEDEQATIDSPSATDIYYSIISMSYQKSSRQHWQWLKSKNFFDVSIGSIDGSRFLIDNRGRFKSYLTPDLEFRFTYFQEQNLETNFTAHNLEMIYWLSPTVGVGIYGEAYFQKRKNDAGLAFFFKPSVTHEIKFFYTFVDLVRNDRNDLRDSFTQGPGTTGIVGRAWETDEEKFFEYSFVVDVPTRWIFPTESYQYHYWKNQSSLYYKNKIEIRLQYDQKHETKFPLPGLTSQVTSEDVTMTRFLSYIRYPLKTDSQWKFTPGLGYNLRLWERANGSSQLAEFIPHFLADNQNWFLEYFATLNNRSIEHRLVTAYQWIFSNKSGLKLVASWDLKGISINKPWGGGNAQFYLEF